MRLAYFFRGGGIPSSAVLHKPVAARQQYIPPHALIARQAVIEIVAVFLSGLVGTVAYWTLLSDSVWLPDAATLLLPNILVALLSAVFALTGATYRLVFVSAAAYRWTGVIGLAKATAVLTIVLFAFKISDTVSRGAVGVQFCVSLIAVLSVRAGIWKWISQRVESGRLSTERVIVIGDLSTRSDVLKTLQARGSIVADTFFFSDSPATVLRRVVEGCRTKSIDRVIIRSKPAEVGFAADLVALLAETPSTVEIVPHVVDLVAGLGSRHAAEAPQTTVVLRNRTLSEFDLVLKRMFDVTFGTFALVALAPVFAATALAIRLEGDGPILFRQARHGYGNRTINVYKFRSMRVVESGETARQATKNDPRISKVGKFIRRTNIDELPQLLNVIAGDMSIVGPRPHPVALNEAFCEQIRLFHRRHNIKPGITGWAQVNGLRGETDTIEKMQKRVEHDIWYVANWSFLLDIRIVLLTLFSPRAYRNAR
jgi:Undecaprenyl-phosphate glucose phosphotransferase